MPNESGVSPFTALTGASLLCPRLSVEKPASVNSQHTFVRDLCRRVKEVDFSTLGDGRTTSVPQSYVPADLETCSHVWLRVDRIRRPLQAPYTGPYRVLTRSSKVFTLELPSGERQTVSVDRLKPAYVSVPGRLSSSRAEARLQSTDSGGVITNDGILDGASGSKGIVSEDAGGQQHIRTKTRSGRNVRFRANPDYLYY